MFVVLPTSVDGQLLVTRAHCGFLHSYLGRLAEDPFSRGVNDRVTSRVAADYLKGTPGDVMDIPEHRNLVVSGEIRNIAHVISRLVLSRDHSRTSRMSPSLSTSASTSTLRSPGPAFSVKTVNLLDWWT